MSFRIAARIVGKIFEKGPAWAVRRVKDEFKSPSFRNTKHVLTAVRKSKRWVGTLFHKDESHDQDYVTAIFDLNSNAITFDFAYFLVGAELFSRKNGKNSFVVWIVQRNNDSRKDEIYNSSVDESSVQWRFENIVLPLINLCPACIGFSVLPEMADIPEAIKGRLVYPDLYDGKYSPTMDYREIYLFARPGGFVGLRASTQGLRYVRSWKEANNLTGPIVTITIRRYGYDTNRNSNIDEWVKFAELIKAKGVMPVFVPDTDACFERDHRLDGFIVFREPCWNLGLRMALYEESKLNFFVSSGPASIAQLNKKIRYICMKIIVPESLQATEDLLEDRGMRIGQRKYDFAEEYQVLSWGEDSVENILDEFHRFPEGLAELLRGVPAESRM